MNNHTPPHFARAARRISARRPYFEGPENLPGTATTEVLVQFSSMPSRTQLASITAKSALRRRWNSRSW